MTDTDTANQSVRHVDAVVIGAGTAGHNAYRQIRKATEKVVIINEGFWSTTCTTVGCMPSKLLIAAAERAYHANNSNDFGIEGTANINGKQVMERVRRERDRFASFPLENVEKWQDSNKIYGRALINEAGLIEAHTATGTTEYLKADHIVIATGSKPFVPEGWKKDLGDLLITSDIIFELPDLPESLAVIGTGAIGLELAQAMHRLGVNVTLFNRSKRVGGLKDELVNDKAIDCLATEMDLRLGTSIESVSREDNANGSTAIIEYKDDKGNLNTWHGSMVLAATGRRTTIHTLGLEHIGVSLDDKNRPKHMDSVTGLIDITTHSKDAESESDNQPNVYIVGDANGLLPVLHVSSNEGYLAGKEIAMNLSNKIETMSVSEAIENDPDCSADTSVLHDVTPDKARKTSTEMTMIFCSPQIANVGQSLNDLKDSDTPHIIGEVSFDNQGRSRIMGENCGLLRIYACPTTRKILGASMVAPDAEYIAHILATAITNDVTVEGLLKSPFYHPTILEGLRTALREARTKIAESQSD